MSTEFSRKDAKIRKGRKGCLITFYFSEDKNSLRAFAPFVNLCVFAGNNRRQIQNRKLRSRQLKTTNSKLSTTMTWLCKKFDDLSSKELYAIMQLRNAVFVVEQNCVYQDADNKDVFCHHLMGFENDQLFAYSRIVPAGISYVESSIG